MTLSPSASPSPLHTVAPRQMIAITKSNFSTWAFYRKCWSGGAAAGANTGRGGGTVGERLAHFFARAYHKVSALG